MQGWNPFCSVVVFGRSCCSQVPRSFQPVWKSQCCSQCPEDTWGVSGQSGADCQLESIPVQVSPCGLPGLVHVTGMKEQQLWSLFLCVSLHQIIHWVLWTLLVKFKQTNPTTTTKPPRETSKKPSIETLVGFGLGFWGFVLLLFWVFVWGFVFLLFFFCGKGCSFFFFFSSF